MYCTKCGIKLGGPEKFCSECGAPTGNAPPPPRTERLTRPMSEAKIAGVCAGFARYFAVDPVVVRIIWVVLTLWPLPLFGVVSYIVAWIIMPKDTVTVSAKATVGQPI